MNTIISANAPTVNRAASWLRDEYSIPFNASITDEFEKEFNCKVIVAPGMIMPTSVEFQTSENLMMFLLKWS